MEPSRPQYTKLMALRRTLTDQESYATTLMTLVLDQYGTEGLTWAAETIRRELEEDFNVKVPSNNIDKVMAAISIVTSDDFYSRLPYFINICNVLSDDEFDPSVFDPADAAEIAWGITESLLLYPPDEAEPFSEEIRFYIGHVLSEEGIISPPDVLQIALRDLPLDDPGNVSADDPEMYEAFFSLQQDKSDELNNMLKRQLGELMEQLESLSLVDGDTKDLLKRMQSGGIA